MKRTKCKNSQPVSKIVINNFLCEIYEENSNDNYNSEALKLENKGYGCQVTFVCDDEIMTNDTSDSSTKGNISLK
jgi:hypothetical protein